jgi:hypothetical protein
MAWPYAENTAIITCCRLIVPGLIILMLLAFMACGQSAAKNRPLDLSRQPVNPAASVQLADRPQDTALTSASFTTPSVGEPLASRWWQTVSPSPFPPASVFALQTDARKYLEAWPSPGTTVAKDGPQDEELTDDDLM